MGEETRPVPSRLRAGQRWRVLVLREPGPLDPKRLLDAATGLASEGIRPLVVDRSRSAILVSAQSPHLLHSACRRLAGSLQLPGRSQPWIAIVPCEDQDTASAAVIGERWIRLAERAGHRRVLTHGDAVILDAVRPSCGEASDWLRAVLAPVFAQPPRARRRLMETLEIALLEDRTVSEAARVLGVNRHTVENRLARVESLTGFSARARIDRTVLLLAVLAVRMDRRPGDVAGDGRGP